jgi:3-oxoacyl-[acyl-carrier protein] reductase
MAKRLQGKVAIVTGAARGLGLAMAKVFASEGAKVLACDMAPAISEEVSGVKYFVLNVTNVQDINKFYNTVVKKYGHVDVLVNNAGITRDSFTAKMSDDQWNLVIDVNLKGVFNVTRAFGPLMVEAGSGSIINIASVVGEYGNVGQANYAASKAGVIGLSKTWAKEFSTKRVTAKDEAGNPIIGPDGKEVKQTVYTKVRCNAIAPGYINTDMMKTVPEPLLVGFRKLTMLGRLGEADEIAKAALFLASDDASYVTGHVLSVNGGMRL